MASTYTYPAHLSSSLEGMPDLPGVYTFHAGADRLPLYIGKSVRLRTRVRSHLRNPAEAAMLRQATHITFIRTAGDIGAQLLEAQRIKQLQPLYNHKLRRIRQLCSIVLLPSGLPHVVYSKDIDFANPGLVQLHGLFSSRHAAIETLNRLADEHGLCSGLLGLEKVAPSKPCFRHMVRKCWGACCGKESRQDHLQRLSSALEQLSVATWPVTGAMGLVEDSGDLHQIHVIRNWCYLGSAANPREAKRLAKASPGFDVDGYKILVGPVLSQSVKAISL